MAKLNASPSKSVPTNLLYDCDSNEPGEKYTTISLRVPGAISSLLENLMKHPSMTNGRSGVLRWSLWYGLSKVAADLKEDKIADELRLTMATSNHRRRQRLHQHYRQALTDMKDTIQNYLDDGMVDAAREQWEEAYATVNAMTDLHWKTKFMADLQRPEWKDIISKKLKGPELVK